MENRYVPVALLPCYHILGGWEAFVCCTIIAIPTHCVASTMCANLRNVFTSPPTPHIQNELDYTYVLRTSIRRHKLLLRKGLFLPTNQTCTPKEKTALRIILQSSTRRFAFWTVCVCFIPLGLIYWMLCPRLCRQSTPKQHRVRPWEPVTPKACQRVGFSSWFIDSPSIWFWSKVAGRESIPIDKVQYHLQSMSCPMCFQYITYTLPQNI